MRIHKFIPRRVHPCADMIRKLKDEIDPDDYIHINGSVFNPDDFVDNLTLEHLNWCYRYPSHHKYHKHNKLT